MVGRPKKRSGFKGDLNNGSENFIFNETENEGFTLQSANTILNSYRIVIPFHPIDRNWQVTQCRFFEIDHVSFTDIVPFLKAGMSNASNQIVDDENCFVMSIRFFCFWN